MQSSHTHDEVPTTKEETRTAATVPGLCALWTNDASILVQLGRADNSDRHAASAQGCRCLAGGRFELYANASKDMAEAELERHIRSCEHLWQLAYARYQIHRDQVDRASAVFWLRSRDAAILARSPEVQARRHEAFEIAVRQRYEARVTAAGQHAQESART
jgi:hypothetical protein